MHNSITAIARLTFLNILRTKIIPIISLFVLLFTFLTYFVTTLFSWDLGKVAVELSLSSSAFVSLVLLFFLCMRLFAEDIEQRTIYLTMARPVTFGQYCLGKYLGVAGILLIVQVIFSLGTSLGVLYVNIANPAYISVDFSWGTYFLAFFCQWFSHLIVLAMTFCWFAFVKQTFVSLMLSVMSYFVGHNIEILRRVLEGEGEGGIRVLVVQIITWLFPNLVFFDLKFAAAYGLELGLLKYGYIILYGVCNIGILLWFTTYFLQKKDLQ